MPVEWTKVLLTLKRACEKAAVSGIQCNLWSMDELLYVAVRINVLGTYEIETNLGFRLSTQAFLLIAKRRKAYDFLEGGLISYEFCIVYVICRLPRRMRFLKLLDPRTCIQM